MSLRARTILAAATATLVAVIVLGLAVDILVARDLRNGLDHNLRTRACAIYAGIPLGVGYVVYLRRDVAGE
jgi:hypothetical protein